MAQVLVVHHTASPATQEILELSLDGLAVPELEGVEVVCRPALIAGSVDVLTCAAVLLLTPANMGYMSGALKHFFDQIYYPCLETTKNLPYALVVHGNNDTVGAVRSVEKLATGLAWQPVGTPLSLIGPVDPQKRLEVTELASRVGAAALGW